jgi:hypothetical protein
VLSCLRADRGGRECHAGLTSCRANSFEQPLGGFRVQIIQDDSGAHEAKVTATLLPPPRLSESQRASGIPSTVAMSIPVDQAIDLTMKLLSAAVPYMTSAQVDEAQRMAREWKPGKG